MTHTSTWIHLTPEDIRNARVFISDDGGAYPTTSVNFGGGAHVNASEMPASEFADELRSLADEIDAKNALRYAEGAVA